MVLGLSLLLGNAFSGAPASEPVSAPVQDAKPVPKKQEMPKVETDFVTDVHLRGILARTATMTEADGTVMPGIEYVVTIELPRRLTKIPTMNRLEVRAAVSGETKNYLGADQFHANHFEIQESDPKYVVYRVHLISYHSMTFDKAKLDELVKRSAADLRIALYADGNKVNDF